MLTYSNRGTRPTGNEAARQCRVSLLIALVMALDISMKITYTNFRKEFPVIRNDRKAFSKWFYIDRYWSGKLIHIGIRHHMVCLDFRGDLFEELTGKKAP
jgi:hypothetical protein